jgi:glycosyltransferase involved in cell wall biosynthesis
MTRVVVVTTHPVQYHVPWIRGLADRGDLDVHVLYGMVPDAVQQGVGFGVPFRWDTPLLDGYAWSVARNRSPSPSLSTFAGIDAVGLDDDLAALRPEVAIVSGWQSRFLLQALRVLRRMSVPVLVRGESNALRPRPLWKRWAHRALLARFDGALAIGASNRDFLRQGGVPEDRIFAAPYAVDGRLFARLAEEPGLREASRARWRIPEPSACFLFAGKLEPKKRVVDLVAAAEALHRERPDTHLLVVGTGASEPAVREAARPLGAAVTFAGFLNQGEMPAAYAAADCLVLPSDYGETWGLVVNEAMACGLPAIVSDRVGCGPDLVRDRGTGFVVPFGDVGALAEAMRRIAADGDARRRMGETARRVVRDFSVERAVEGTAEGVAGVARATRRHGALAAR